MSLFQTTLLPLEKWTSLAKNHADLVGPIAEDFILRRSLGKTDAVKDFLFIYYNTSPTKLKQWVPSFEMSLLAADNSLDDYPWLNTELFKKQDGNVSLNLDLVPKRIFGLCTFISNLMNNISNRPARFGCFGLHEWAMVYKQSPEEIRHNQHPLRMPANQLAEFVESQTLRCTHYDAYRFFTKDASLLNLFQPTLESRLEMEQGGCIHANMDLYKWASKLWPWIGSDFIAKTFFLSFQARELDMRASPYDLKDQGYQPICIETEEGRKRYQKEQMELSEKTAPLRQELKEFCECFLSLYSKQV